MLVCDSLKTHMIRMVFVNKHKTHVFRKVFVVKNMSGFSLFCVIQSKPYCNIRLKVKQDRFTTYFKNMWNNPLWILALQKKIRQF